LHPEDDLVKGCFARAKSPLEIPMWSTVSA
jgi:hypothetical protein